MGLAALRAPAYGALEWLWATGFSIAGRGLRSRSRTTGWRPLGGGRVLVIAPHPDDETIGAGGVISLHQTAGDRVTVVCVSDGGASRALGLSRSEMVDRRAREFYQAARALGIEKPVWLGLPEGRWDRPSAGRALRSMVEAADVIYAPSCIDYHPEHQAVAQVVADLVAEDSLVRLFEIGVPLTPWLVNCVADISSAADLKAQALAQYATQQRTLAALHRLARYRSALYGYTAVEVFWEMPGKAYRRLMAERRLTEHAPYRGIGGRPLADPLAFLVGLADRLRLRRRIMDHLPTEHPQPAASKNL